MDEREGERLVDMIHDLVYRAYSHGIDPHRPYDGQPHTDQGKRGETVVAGLTYRDVCDCFVIGWLSASSIGQKLLESREVSYNDVFQCDDDVDPLAVMQNMACEMEKRQGIYPNVPALRAAPEEGTR